jgi:adenosylhomocysteinase
MTQRIEWVRQGCRLLTSIASEFELTRPFAGLTIGTGIHLEPKTVALLLTLKAGGARVVSTGNLNSTQQTAIDYLSTNGVEVIGGPTSDPAEHAGHLAGVLAAKPDLILDNGGDLFALHLDRPFKGLLGGTEETTSGRARLVPLRDRLAMPILVINDSPIKQFAENRHAVGQSVLESFIRMTNQATNGRRVVVFGYGACGKGVALNFRNAHALVSVVDVDPVARLEALWDGFDVPDRAAALQSAEIVITVTGAPNVITAADLDLLRDGVILANAGHFPHEIAISAFVADPRVVEHRPAEEGISTFALADGRSFNVLGGGHMMNLAGPRPLGNSIESMDLGFSLQARCLEAIARRQIGASDCVVPVPRFIDEQVASAYVALTQ